MLTTEGDVDPMGYRAAEQLISDGTLRAVAYCQQTASTNTLALTDLQGGAMEVPKLFLVDTQTDGRGRHGRTWISNSGTLTFSLAVDRPTPHVRSSKLMSLAVGVAIARSLEFEFAPLQAKLKWPNDVYIDGGKVAGILLETTQKAPKHVVIGVGMNVADKPDLGDEADSVRSVAQVVGRQVNRYELLYGLVASIIRAISEEIDSPNDLLAEFRSRCLLTGGLVRFRHGGHPREGRCIGVSEDGELLVDTKSGLQRLQSGEAHLVRVRSVS
jgi:BirA family biotin operon repressor/biotin-[acetyl-CoA-carboxylase] ligase